MYKTNFNLPTTQIINENYEIFPLNFSRIIGGLTLYPNFSYIGLNSRYIVNNPTETEVIGNTPFVTPKYNLNYQVQQFGIGDLNGEAKPNYPVIRIAFRAVVGTPTDNDLVTFTVIVSNAGNKPSYTNQVENEFDYVWDIGYEQALTLDAFSNISLLVSHPDNETIEIYPYSLTMSYQQISLI